MKTSGSESRPRKIELASAHKNTMSTVSISHSLAWPDRFFPFFFVTAQKNGKPVVTKKNGKKRSGQATLYLRIPICDGKQFHNHGNINHVTSKY